MNLLQSQIIYFWISYSFFKIYLLCSPKFQSF